MSEGRIVITGTGAVSAAGVGYAALRQAVESGQSCIGPISTFDASQFPIRIGGQVPDFQPERYIERKVIVRTPRNTHFAFVAAAEAMCHAGLDLAQEDPNRVGGIMATTVGGAEYSERGLVPLFTKGPSFVSPFLPTTLLFNGALAQVAIKHNLRGATQTVASEGAGGLDSLRIAMELLQDGEVDAALVGGCEATLWPGFILTFAGLEMHAASDGDPTQTYRPFDKRRSGMVLGEGAALLVMEREEHARARGAAPRAEVAGFGATFDASDPMSFDSTGEQYARAMRQAMAMAGVQPREIDAVIAEGRGTPEADVAEANAITQALGGAPVPITCTKGTLGYSFSAAGALDAVCALQMMEHCFIPPLANLDTPGVDVDLDFVRDGARRTEVRTVLIGARGLGGVNAAVVLRRLGGS